MALDNYKEITSKIPALSGDEKVMDDANLTGPDILRRLQYAANELGRDTNATRYAALQFADYLNLRRTSTDGGHLLLHDSDIDRLRIIFNLKGKNAKLEEIKQFFENPSPEKFAMTEIEPILAEFSRRMAEQMSRHMESVVDELVGKVMEAAKKENVRLLEQKELEERFFEEEIRSLKEELLKRDEAHQKELQELNEKLDNMSKKKRFSLFGK